MNVLENTPQGSAVWLAIRAQCDTASEAPAARGASKYQSRNDLIKQKATGLTPEVDHAKQVLFDRGHESEAGARGLAEAIIGSELFPVTATLEIDGLKLLASLDGATMDETLIWEHKLFSEKLAADVRAGTLDPHYTIQMDQQLLVSGAKKCLFMTSDGTEANMAWCWYEPSQEKFAALIAGWKQFRADLVAYVPAAAEPAAVAKVVTALAVVLDMQVEGKLVSCNIAQYKPAALAYIEGINSELKDDQDFANATADAKYCRDSADKLETAIELAMGKMGDVNTVLNTVREIAASFDAKGLALEKLVDKRKEEIKIGIVLKAKQAYSDHIALIELEIAPIKLPLAAPDFGQAAKGKRTVATMQDAVDTALATGKISADAMAQQIRLKQAWFGQAAKGYEALFADMQTLIQKPTDDFQLAVKTRVDAQVQKEEKLRQEAVAVAVAKPAVNPEQRADELFDEAHPPAGQPAPPANVVPMRSGGSAARVAPTTPPTLKLGQIGERLGFALTADFLKSLGFEPAARDKSALLFHESSFTLICAALVAHVNQVQAKQAA